MTHEQQLILESLAADLKLFLADRQKGEAKLAEIAARLARIERALAIPLSYSLRQTCSRMGYAESWGRKHPELLPYPSGRKPLRYLVGEVEALVARGLAPGDGRRRPRGSREKAAS